MRQICIPKQSHYRFIYGMGCISFLMCLGFILCTWKQTKLHLKRELQGAYAGNAYALYEQKKCTQVGKSKSTTSTNHLNKWKEQDQNWMKYISEWNHIVKSIKSNLLLHWDTEPISIGIAVIANKGNRSKAGIMLSKKLKKKNN